MDVVEGRPPGTGRSSRSLPKGGESSFAGFLARGSAGGEPTGGASLSESIERGIEDQVADRIRALEPATREREGERSDAGADRAARGRAEGSSPRSDAADDGRTSEPRRTESRRATASREAEAGVARTEERAAPAADEGEDSVVAFTDPAAAKGAEASSARAAGHAAGHAAGPAPTHDPIAGGTIAPASSLALVRPTDNVAPALAAAPRATGVAHAAASAPLETKLERQAAHEARQAAAPRDAQADLELAESVMRQLRARIQLGERDAVIELRPRELGRIAVHLQVAGGAVHATLRAESRETLALLEAHAPELRSWLAQSGLDVSELDLGLAEGRSSSELFSGRREGGEPRDGGGAHAPSPARRPAQPAAGANLGTERGRSGSSSNIDFVA